MRLRKLELPIAVEVCYQTYVNLSQAQADDGLLTSGIPSSPVKLTGDRQPLHNLSAWRVSIPSVVQRPDPDNPRKVIYVFLVEVWRLDVSEGG